MTSTSPMPSSPDRPAAALAPGALTEAAVDSLLLDTTPWLSCEECFERMDRYVEAAVAQEDQRDVAMARHLAGCAACREEAESLIEFFDASPH
ncbi:hypothetical protein [Pedococcus sp. 5OH_020]|uniref:hypothetical protein n=1 Tax=Pedococcus sp. 5OH_020 TaxID=2989814 RepID=UPI0022E9EAFC|nr:hypothetical protein [Pedococcus sp. 5OH_020]